MSAGTYNYGHNFLRLLITWYKRTNELNSINELPHELPNELRLRILGN